MASEKKTKYLNIRVSEELLNRLKARKVHRREPVYEVIQRILTEAEFMEAETVDVTIIPKGNVVEIGKTGSGLGER